MNVFLSPYKKYAVFSGRATPGEYWGFLLSSIVFAIVVLFPISILIGDTKDIIITLYSLALFLPYLAVAIRRLHDTNRSAWWIFINLLPIFGGLAFLVFMIVDGTPGENKYGPNPKQVQMN
jgi:uncharacterized membrane protein YhaH (DUF805 family)